MDKQTTNSILLVRPANFGYNTETAISNAFQNKTAEKSSTLKQKASAEFEDFGEKLRAKGIDITIADDTEFPIKPDAIFPNNWGSFHSDGTVVLYPMLAKNRRAEKRKQIIDLINEKYELKKLIDLSEYEEDETFLEGTGSIIFDHINKIAYSCISPRTDKGLFIKVCKLLKYEPVYFYSHDKKGKEIYHTNVMMTVGNGFAVVCLESILDKKEKNKVIQSLTKTGHKIIDISYEQVNSFCGNMIELEIMDNKNILAMSQSAYNVLRIL